MLWSGCKPCVLIFWRSRPALMSTCTLLDRIINRAHTWWSLMLCPEMFCSRDKTNWYVAYVSKSVCSLCTPEGFTQLGHICPHVFSLMLFQTRINVSFHAEEVNGSKKVVLVHALHSSQNEYPVFIDWKPSLPPLWHFANRIVTKGVLCSSLLINKQVVVILWTTEESYGFGTAPRWEKRTPRSHSSLA